LTASNVNAQNGLYVEFAAAGVGTLASGNYICISDIQLEVGDSPTAYEFRPAITEWQLCQRYFQKSYGGNPPGTNTGLVDTIEETVGVTDQPITRTIRFPTRMRTVPSIAIFDAVGNAGKITTNGSNHNIAPSVGADNQSAAGFKVWHAGTGVVRVSFHWQASAEL
jgi:hypothetical protein